MIILGEKEMNDNSISIRRRFIGDQGSMDIDSFIKETVNEINTREKSQVDSDA